VAIEDSTNGLRAAAAAGMIVVAIPNRAFPPARETLARADVVLDSIRFLDPPLLAGLRRGARRPTAPRAREAGREHGRASRRRS
jgi:beta-phosphoglucomutase-like phosphatase (HAD superfamily)